MTARLSLLAAACLLLLFMTVMRSSGGPYAVTSPLIVSLVSLATIVYTIWSDAEFNIAGDILLVSRPFHGQKKYSLRELRQWEETSYHIRGQRMRTLTLVFHPDQIVELSNKDYKANYDSLLKHLKKYSPLIEKFNMSLMQEIQFNSLHRFLTTDFYFPGDKYSPINEDKNRSLSLEIFKMKLEGADRNQLAKTLLAIKTRILGEHETISACQRVADRVIEF